VATLDVDPQDDSSPLAAAGRCQFVIDADLNELGPLRSNVDEWLAGSGAARAVVEDALLVMSETAALAIRSP
jgi:hypothetical protein